MQSFMRMLSGNLHGNLHLQRCPCCPLLDVPMLVSAAAGSNPLTPAGSAADPAAAPVAPVSMSFIADAGADQLRDRLRELARQVADLQVSI